MPVTLHHGRASQDKRQQFFSLWQASGGWNTLVLTASRRHARALFTKALSLTQKTAVLGEPFLAFGDFLLALLKANRPRVHQTDAYMSGALLYHLIQKTPHFSFTHPDDPWPEIQSLLSFFDQLKASGWDPDFARAKLAGKNNMAVRLELYREHTRAMKALHFYRPADLLLDALTLLKKNPVWPKSFPQALHIQDIYPLGPGERAIIRGLKDAWPKLPIHIHYDEDYTQDDLRLSAAYEDLGNLSDDQSHFVSPPPHRLPVHVFSNTAAESRHILTQLRFQLKESSQAACLAFAQTDMAKTWWMKMAASPIARHLNPTLPAKSFLQTNDEASALKTHLQSLYAARPYSGLTEKWRALKAREDFDEQKRFIESTLGNEWFGINLEDKKIFWHSLQESLRLPATAIDLPIHFVSLAKADAYLEHSLHVAGLNLEALMQRDQDAFIDENLAESRDLAETLQPPGYRFRLTLARLRRLAALCPQITFSSAKFDDRGSPLTQLKEIADDFTCLSVQTPRSPNQKSIPATFELLAEPKNSYALTSLQTYLDCPHKYYLSKALRLKDVQILEPDPRSNLKGNLVHEVLETFVKNHLDTYTQPALRPTAPNVLEDILNTYFLTASAKEADWLLFPQSARDVFQTRTISACAGFIRREWTLLDAGDKQTLPTKTEWDFETTLPNSDILIHGRIDRIDCTPDGRHFSVIDYKTGSPGEHGLTAMKDGRFIQLPVYLYAVSKILYPEAVPTAALVCFLSDGSSSGITRKNGPDAKSLKSAQDDDKFEEVLSSALIAAKKAALGIQSQIFDPHPRSATLCSKCTYITVCANPAPLDEESQNEAD